MSTTLPNDLPQRTQDQFWSRVDRTPGLGPKGECWIFRGAGTGYGRAYRTFSFQYDGKQRNARAHRLSWVLTFGTIPDGLFVLHVCDNPPCCNPHHLFIGTHAQNMRDRNSKGRMAHGTKIWSCKLSPDQVLRIRGLCDNGLFSHAEIGAMFGIARKYVGKIGRREKWKHLPE